MSDITKIQWCDSTVNPIMGCGGCELFPESPRKVMEAVDQAIREVDGEWVAGKAAEIMTDLIHEQVQKIQNHPGFKPGNHLDKLTNTNIWHLREAFNQRLKSEYSEAVAEAALHEIGQQVTCYAATLHLNKGYSILNPDRKVNRGYAPTFERMTKFRGRVAKMSKMPDLFGTADPFAPWKDGLPRMIFVSDMGDALAEHSAQHLDWLEKEVMEPIRSPDGQRHLWLWLTKRPQTMAKFAKKIGGFPGNVCAMTTLTGADRQNLVRLEKLKEVDADIRGLSVEPLWDRIPSEMLDLTGIDWLIVGGESGSTNARPFDLAWARELRDMCREKGVAFFCKQLGRNPVDDGVRMVLKDGHGGNWEEWPEELQVRQFPQAFWMGRNLPATLKPIRVGKSKLTAEDQKDFKRLDQVVQTASKSVVKGALALAEIQKRKLYRDKHKTFEDYCRTVHNLSRQYAYNLLAAGKVSLELSAIADKFGLDPALLPDNEAQLRELGRVKDPEARCELLAEVVAEKGCQYTAIDIRFHVQRRTTDAGQPGKKKDSATVRLPREEIERLTELLGKFELGPEAEALLAKIGMHLR